MPARTPAELQTMFQQAANEGDLDGLLALYEADPAFAEGPGTATGTGQQELRAHLERLLVMRPTFDRVETTKVFESDGIALTCSDWAARATDLHGRQFEMAGRGTEVARRQPDGTWRLVIDNPWGTE